MRTPTHFALALLLAAATILMPATLASAQGQPVNGMRPADLRAHALVGATVVLAPGHVVEHATVLVRDGVIEAVGTDIHVPVDARVWDCTDLTIYPGLIEPALFIEAANRPASAGVHWNERIVPQVDMSAEAAPSSDVRSSLRALGFTAAVVYPSRGALRGTGVMLGLADKPEHIVKYEDADVAMAAAFDHGGGFRSEGGVYPNSLMGSIAQIRQALLDAQWHAACKRVYAEHAMGHEPPKPNEALDALAKVIAGEQALLFETNDETAALRAARIMREFSLSGVILGCGLEFVRIDEIAALGLPIVLPLEYPKRPDVADIAQAEQTSLREMMVWEQAPTNPRRLMQAGVTVALTTHDLRSRNTFYAALRKAIDQGLTEDQALAALTTVPARLLGVDDVMGSIQPGKIANLVIVEGSLFESKSARSGSASGGPKIRDVWVNGRRHEVSAEPTVKLASKGTMTTSNGFLHETAVDTEKKSLSITLPPEVDSEVDSAPEVEVEANVEVEVEGQDAEDATLSNPESAEASGPQAQQDENAQPVDDAKPVDEEAIVPPADDAAAVEGKEEGDESKKRSAKAKTIKAKAVTVQNDRISAIVDGKPFDAEGFVQISGTIVGERIVGTGVMPDGSQFSFTYEPAAEDGEDEDEALSRDSKSAKGSAPAGDDEANPEEEDAPKPDADAEWNKLRARVSGTWRAMLEHEGQSQPLQLQLLVREDSSVLGSVSALGEVHPIVSGTLDREGSELRLNVESPDLEQPLTITAEIDLEANVLRGSIVSSELAADFEASRPRKLGAKEDESSEPGSASPNEKEEGADDEDDDQTEVVLAPEELNLPLGEYGLTAPPTPVSILITNATIWTSGPEGIIENGFMGIRMGRIEFISASESDAAKFREKVRAREEELFAIDGRNKHISPGLIDCHSHTGIHNGINEFMQVNTAEVRIQDVLDPDDINWYRQLAGGLTACNQLHGSANPIGGQSATVKIRWGSPFDSYHIPDSMPGIKFALGENVKRSQGRYPNTRMGVETTIRDAFTAARDYDAEWQRYLDLSPEEQARTMPPRRDLELETLVEILHSKRKVHCHSYRQDEILMLLRLAEQFGFTIGTLQHVLEGYKVADAIAAHGAGASSFSDWWAYKVEVMDAIPYSPALMTAVGVLVSVNSDSNELARRMNTEAAKAVRYGGMEPEEALKLVTLNPAKQLGVDHRIGSLEVGKDGDFVIWSDSPLSTYARCEQTWIEGARYFDLDEDQQLRQTVKAERSRLIQKILDEAHGDKSRGGSSLAAGPASGGARRGRPTISDAWLAMFEDLQRRGRSTDEIMPGDCGCSEMHFHFSSEH
jgi:imidazolonepropionase-like amidohydrolase